MKPLFIDSHEEWLELVAHPERSCVEWEGVNYRPRSRNVRIGPGRLDHHLLLYVDHGEFSLTLEGEHHSLSRGELLWLSPDTLRCLESPTRESTDNYRVHFNITSQGKLCRIIDNYIVNHIHEPLNAAELANQLKLSQGYFSLLFKNTYGLAPRSHIKRERIHLSTQRLAQSDLKISEVAREFGYDNPFLYSRQFRNVMHCSPRDYRKRFL